ncbi:hypothetical protein Metvu_1092 [Methanocaldococcus vulcanius M7]|uniref:Uncharacterized protein n=1 Tax=Methanocaldococcus vulcanius (strain ATCC 700851 / DSM 12094 / M7) TaxID=579137 RepID=C9RH98_METVM|nr:hypothetical protein [Methanocaldococcus vulcanius]ACX72950.1 hypothetical protein Metvu_1092 [Methanocaldococcus vulcanius M7]
MDKALKDTLIKNIVEIDQKITRLEWLLTTHKNEDEIKYIQEKINELKLRKEEYLNTLRNLK